jgi:hypothetical protein
MRRVTEYQITSWRAIPSMVTARHGDEVVKIQLAQRFQEAIDEAAMQADAADADAYLAGWVRGEWIPASGSPAEVAETVGRDLESQYDEAALAVLIAKESL